MYECYFDESGTHDSSPSLCVGGFVIETERAKEMLRLWEDMLDRYKLKYFHMTDCANHADQYRALSLEECDKVAREAYGIIRAHISHGVMVSIIPKEHQQFAPNHSLFSSSYSLCAYDCLAGVKRWIEKTPTAKDIVYFFEQGHVSEREADGLMKWIFEEPLLRHQYRYVGHGFYDKRKVKLLQAADVIAWHWNTEMKRQAEKKRPQMRKDTVALMQLSELGVEYMALPHNPISIKIATETLWRDLYPLTYPGRL